MSNRKPKLHYRLYVLMRNDLPSMNVGKAMAQAAHASNQFIHEWGFKPSVKIWQKEGSGFGTTITLAVDDKTLSSVIRKANRMKVPCGFVIDTTYPMLTNREIASLISPNIQTDKPIFKDNGQVIIFRREVTCGYVFLSGNSPESIELVGGLPLHP